MLNLLRFRPVADYSASPELAPAGPFPAKPPIACTWRTTLPFLHASGGEILFYGKGGGFFIGPIDERWDAAMLIRQSSVAAFFAFASNEGYLSGMGIALPRWKTHACSFGRGARMTGATGDCAVATNPAA